MSSSGTRGLIRLPSKRCCKGDICWDDAKALAWCPAQSKPGYPLPTFRWLHQSFWFRENPADQKLPLLWLFLTNGSSYFLISHWNPVSEFPACLFYFFFLMWAIFKVFLESVTILLLWFMFWFFSCKICGILIPWPGIKPVPTGLEGKDNHWTTREVTPSCLCWSFIDETSPS